MTKTLKRIKENRKDVRYTKPFNNTIGGYKAAKTSAETFQNWMYDEKAYDCLAPLWHLREHMGKNRITT